MDDKKKKKKGKFSFLASLASLGSGKAAKTKGEKNTWEGKAGGYFENKKSTRRKLDEVFK